MKIISLLKSGIPGGPEGLDNEWCTVFQIDGKIGFAGKLITSITLLAAGAAYAADAPFSSLTALSGLGGDLFVDTDSSATFTAAVIAALTSAREALTRDDFVLLTDNIKSWIVRIEDISLLEAHRNFTLVHFPHGKLLIRRSLKDCERRLDSSIFLRANRDCIVNLSQVKQPRLSNDGGVIFLLKDGKEIMLSRRQTVLFRASHGL
jgi:DNA-binding LytR/AlgR family response regulator